MQMNDYPLIPTDPGALDAEMIAAYEALTGAVVRPGSPEMLFIKWVEGGSPSQRPKVRLC